MVLGSQCFVEDTAHLRRVRLINHATNARNKPRVISLVMAMRFYTKWEGARPSSLSRQPPRWFFTDHGRIKTDGSMPDKADVELGVAMYRHGSIPCLVAVPRHADGRHGIQTVREFYTTRSDRSSHSGIRTKCR